jgi:hypothetical protein
MPIFIITWFALSILAVVFVYCAGEVSKNAHE